MRKIFWASDSTVQTNKFMTYPQTGIGQVFSLYTKDDVTVVCQKWKKYQEVY